MIKHHHHGHAAPLEGNAWQQARQLHHIHTHAISEHVRSSLEALTWPYRCAVLAQSHGFAPRAIREIEIAAAELAANTLRHGGGGMLYANVSNESDPVFEMIAEDEGPGFNDIELALQDGVSRGVVLHKEVPTFRSSLGAGLGAIQRLTDELFIMNRPEGGAYVIARKRSA